MFKLTNIAVIIFAAFVVNLIVFIISWRRRNSKSGLYFAWGMLGVTIWTFFGALDYAAVSLSLKIVFSKIAALGYLSAIPLFAVNSIYFAGNDRWLEKAWFKNLLVFIPLAISLIVITNEWHGWMWQSYEALGGNIFYFERGAAYEYIMFVYYMLLALIFLNFWMAFRKGSDFVKRQARLMMFAVLFPLITNLIYQIGFPGVKGVDWTSITFSITGAIFLYALHGFRFLDVIPIARDKLFNNLSDGMIVLDTQNRMIDINQPAIRMFNLPPEPAIGKKLAELIPAAHPFFEQPPELETRAEIQPEGTNYYIDVLISPLYDNHKTVLGRLLIVRDITARKENEFALQKRFLEIQELHKKLQEMQAQLVEQQRAHAKLEERQRLGRDMHDSVNQSIHSLMLFSETLVALLEKEQTEKALSVAKRIQDSGEQALKEIRLLVYEAQSMFADENTNLIKTLEERLNMVERRVRVRAKIVQGGDPLAQYPAAWSENLYWIIIEALNNSLKYSQAGAVQIIFNGAGKELKVEIVDDGAGFDSSKIQSGGFGMRSMRERAAILGGQLVVTSVPGSGTRVSVKINWENEHG